MKEFFEVLGIIVLSLIVLSSIFLLGPLVYAKYAYDFPIKVTVDNKIVYEGPAYLVWESYPSITIKEKAYSYKTIKQYRSSNIKIMPLNQ